MSAGPGRSGDRRPDAVLLTILRDERRPHAAADLAERTGIPLPTVKRALGKLVRDREARRAGGDCFTTAAHPPKAPGQGARRRSG